ncbi:MAG: type IV secretory system conjugative DNA transfer family protein [Candidatus Kerfeldbacteria bacterium]|nr:type IV secretory system conjugative DNA transfer family protein [Candidatus Kerfeldbacteria bacterium]
MSSLGQTGFLVAVIGIAVLAVAGMTLLAVAVSRVQKRRSRERGHELAVLLVRVPKESEEKADEEQALDAQIARAETLFSIIGGMKAERGLRVLLRGRREFFSFEIVAQNGLISFYVVAPASLQQFFEEQVHAQYPHAEIELVEDYNAFTPQGVAVGTTLSFVRPPAFPLRTYKRQDGDPLNALTNALSRLAENESAVIQFVARSAHPRWHASGSKIADALRSGKSKRAAIGSSKANATLNVLASTLRTSRDDDALTGRSPGAADQQLIELLEEKTAKAGLEVMVRLLVSAPGEANAKARLQGLAGAFGQYRYYESGNGFRAEKPRTDAAFMESIIYRTFETGRYVIVNAEEMASLFHLPLPTTETPNINWLTARKLPAPVNVPLAGVLLGKNVYRGSQTLIHMKEDDRRRHMYVIGTTGTGKSILLANMAIQDMHNGKGVAIIDPHGSLAELVLENVPPHRVQDVLSFDPADVERPVGLNMLEARDAQEADFAVQEMIAIFYKLVTDPSFIGPMFEHNMRNAMLTLMANPEHPGTIADIPRIFTDTAFQKYSVKFVTDPIVRAFWEKEMAKTSDYHKSEMLGYLISKVGRFVENAMMRNIIGQPKSGFNFREIMDQSKIFIVNLSKGKIGETNSNLLGLILVSKLQMAALARADMPEEARKDFYLYIDEFQNFITDSIAIILSEARKYRLNLIMAHQYVAQLVNGQDTKVRDAVFGNVGTIAAFRVGVDDAELLAQQLAPLVTEYDLINIERFHAYVRLLIDNTAAKTFSMGTFPPAIGSPERAAQIREFVRMRYGMPREEIEREILLRTKLGESAPATPPAAQPRVG